MGAAWLVSRVKQTNRGNAIMPTLFLVIIRYVCFFSQTHHVTHFTPLFGFAAEK